MNSLFSSHEASFPSNAGLSRLRHAAVALALLIGLCPWAVAQVPSNITAGEMALLPEYCPDTQGTLNYTDPAGGNPSPRASHWANAMGQTFWAMHHHCWALIRMHRSRQPGIPEPIREGSIRGAIADYIYVLNNERPGFPMKPEVLVRLGEAYAALPLPGEALEAYKRARQEKPDYWPAYTWAADALMTMRRRKEAVELLEAGLAVMPGNREISNKLEQIKRRDSPNAREASPPTTKLRRPPAVADPRAAKPTTPAAKAQPSAKP